jgi:hypothetical protein
MNDNLYQTGFYSVYKILLGGGQMSLSVKDIAGALKLEERVVERLAKYLYPNKILLTKDEALVLRDYYYKFGGGPASIEVGPYNEWMKYERMTALFRARLDIIEEKQSACVTKLNALAGSFHATDEKLPAKVQPRGHSSSLIKFPVAKTVSKPVAGKDRRPASLFAGLSVRS